MRVTVTYRQVFVAQRAMGTLMQMEASGTSKIALRRFGRHLDRALEDIEPERQEMLRRYADLNEHGEPKFGSSDSSGQQETMFSNGKREAFVAEFGKLQDEAKVSIECIEAVIFEHVEGAGVVGLMLALGDLVFDPEETEEHRPKRVTTP